MDSSVATGTSEKSAVDKRWRVLAVLCVAVFTINLDGTIVNVALPTLVRTLGASTTRLQWVVDAYQLAFCALVLAAGSMSDRYGRKNALILGLALFGVATALGALGSSTGQLIGARAVMGIGAAMVFPNTLSILSNVFPDRTERAKAIGAWGATTGMGVALGPIAGGFLLEHFWWGSVFLAMAPVAAVAIVLTVLWVPNSRDPSVTPMDLPGLLLSTAAIGVLVYTVIEAPVRGWSASASLTGFVVAAVLFAAFVVWERRVTHPMLDVGLFANLRFSAASGAVTIAFFALLGFIFLITMYFQFLHAYSPLSTGVRLLPVAFSLGATSTLGPQLAVRIGNKAVVASGLLLMTLGFTWIATSSSTTSYYQTIGQMLVLAGGLGFATAPATEAIMGVVPKDKAAVGSAVNDATRELGGTLGVAVIGSVFASLYLHALDRSHTTGIASALMARARESVGDGLAAARQLGASDPHAGDVFMATVRHAFFHGFQAGCLVAAGASLLGAVFIAIFLPSHPGQDTSLDAPSEMETVA
jgi:EmrB/QacA subfamily drug resistance transporter